MYGTATSLRLSLRQKEILHLPANGVTVIGCSSLGALRAAELHPQGMTGSGQVFAMYRDGVADGDDEVAVAHDEAPRHHTSPYRRRAVKSAGIRNRRDGTRHSLPGPLLEGRRG
ncbi:TfuA-like protein [Nonomuraea sp. SBT364]|uniref:TfuA-like protein n=1 Tax=Nonomuraea sp. SBT364 TaxID=1580530 RepID=UPI0018CF2A19